MLLMSALTVTSVPAFQYVAGRQCTSESLIQCQAPCWFEGFRTLRWSSMDALSVTGTSNRTITGMPTPTVSPFTGAKLGKVCWSRLRSSVRKDDRLTVSMPSSSTATVCTRYRVPGSRRSDAVQVALSADREPASSFLPDRTTTLSNVPSSAASFTTLSTFTPWCRTLKETVAAERAGAAGDAEALAEDDDPEPAWAPSRCAAEWPASFDEQPAAIRHRATRPAVEAA